MLASAATDRPSLTYRSGIAVDAPREVIWALLTELDHYAEWNPYITRAHGDMAEGSSIELTYAGEGDVSADVLIVHPMRKLEWRSRTLAPGILDREQVIRVVPDGEGGFYVVQDVRLEGVLAVVSDLDAERAGFQAMLSALRRAASDYQSSGP